MADRKVLIERYGRSIVHLRQALRVQRLGLALGAGVSLEVGFPAWSALLKGIDDQIKGLGAKTHYDAKETSEPTQAQILFAAYREHIFRSDATLRTLEGVLQEAEVAARWRGVVHSVLYSSITDPEAALDKHPYIRELAALAKRLRLVVNYNFDDMLERALAKNAKQQPDSRTVGYVTAWGPNFVVQDDRPVIYHPNGFLPYHLIDRGSDRVILTEEALSDQTLDLSIGAYQTLLDYFARCPVLLVGFSLSDPAQRALLRQAVRLSPGVVHYYVHWCGHTRPTPEQQREIAESNFALFGIVTLFLDNEELRLLLELVVTLSDDEFKAEFFRARVPYRYKYYVSGAVSVGKTTAISMLKGLAVVDEWLTPRLPLIARPSTSLSPDEKAQVDQWIMEQLRLKNQRFRNAEPGLHIMDRAPLDAFAFTPWTEVAAKAEMLWNEACAGGSEPFERGQLVLLKGRPDDLAVRQRWRGRGGDNAYLGGQQNDLFNVYVGGTPGAIVIDSGGLTPDVVARRIAKAIHFDAYEEFDFDGSLQGRRAKA